MSQNPVRQKFSRHFDIRNYDARELVLAGFLKLVLLHTVAHKIIMMVADARTKSLQSPMFVGHHQIMTGHVPFANRLGRCMGG